MKRRNALAFTAAILLPLMLVSTGCDDDAYVTLYDANASRHPPPCLALQVFPPDPEAERTLRRLYPFRDDCPWRLELSTKAGIHCNSNANAPLKATSNFPSAYLRLELRRGMRLIYSYYLDLTHAPNTGDIQEAYRRFQKDLHLPR